MLYYCHINCFSLLPFGSKSMSCVYIWTHWPQLGVVLSEFYILGTFFVACVTMKKTFLFAFSLQEQLRRLYPRLKVLAFGAKPESTLHTYLPSFLSRATPHCPDDMKREVRPTCSLVSYTKSWKKTFWKIIAYKRFGQKLKKKLSLSLSFFPSRFFPPQLLSSMTECLCVDVQSLGVWRQLYTKHLPQSRWVIHLFCLLNWKVERMVKKWWQRHMSQLDFHRREM